MTFGRGNQSTGGPGARVVSRVYVVAGDHVEERIVTVGPARDGLVEITNGLKAGERVATKHVAQIADGTKVS